MSHFLSLFSNSLPSSLPNSLPDALTKASPPVWFMRQAGRYLPEYRETRKQAGSFLELCYAPDLACEVTLQPLRRFSFDAAILFADILLLPQALGQKLWFVEGEGPRLNPIVNANTLHPEKIHETLSPVYETVSLLNKNLPNNIPLIGFAGSPWTVATYMIAGKGTPAQEPAHALIQSDVSAFASIIDVLVDATIAYLKQQVDHGAQCLQLFDSWASSLSGDALEVYCFEPNRKIIERLRQQGVTVPIIGFPRAIGNRVTEFVAHTGVDAVGLDQSVDLAWACDAVPEHVVTQGNLDPSVLVQGGVELDRAVENILEITHGRKHIFNLGHGIVPQTPPENVQRVLEIIKAI